MAIPKRCIEETQNVRIVCAERRSKITFVNEKGKNIKKVKVDGCAITSGVRCDYLIVDETNYEFFVELKGSNVKHACDQLRETINKLSKDPKKKEKHSYIISSRVPLTGSDVQKLKLEFKKKFNCFLKIETIKCSVKIS